LQVENVGGNSHHQQQQQHHEQHSPLQDPTPGTEEATPLQQQQDHQPIPDPQFEDEKPSLKRAEE
jgi:hypothetical protein